MHHRHVLDLPEITTLLVAYLSPFDVLSCLCVCQYWRRVFEQELWRRTIINPLPPFTIAKNPPKNHKQPFQAFIAAKLLSYTSQLPHCRYCLPRALSSSRRRFFGQQEHVRLHNHPSGLEITRRLNPFLVQSKGHLIQSLEGLDPKDTLLTAVAMHCVHLRHLELVIKSGLEPSAQATALSLNRVKERIWPSPPWTVEEDSMAIEAFMKAVARVRDYGELFDCHGNDDRKRRSVPQAPIKGCAMELQSVCVVFEDTTSDFRLLWSLRHLPNLRKLEIQGPGQWINRIVNNEPDRMLFFLEDLIVVLERCVRIEEMVLSSLQLVSSATNGADGYSRDIRCRRNKHFGTLLDAPLIDSSTKTTPPSLSSLRSLALPILPHRIDVCLQLLQSIGAHLHDLDLTLVEWNCRLPESTTHMLSLLSACPVLRTVILRFKPDPPRENTAIQDLAEFTRILSLPTEDEVRRMIHQRQQRWWTMLGNGQHGPPAAYSCFDFAKLATVFPQSLVGLSLMDVQIGDTNLMSVDPALVQGIRHLHVLYRRCMCPVEVLERVLGVWRGLVRVEMGAVGFQDRDSRNSNAGSASSFHVGGQQHQGGGTPGISIRDRQLVEAIRGTVWACRYTLRHLDLCQMDVYLYPLYCEMLLVRIRELEALRDLRIDLRCLRVGQNNKSAGRVGGSAGMSTGTGTGNDVGSEEEVDLSLRPKFEWRQLDRLFVHGARQISTGDSGVATVVWFEPLRADEMCWIREEVLDSRAKFSYCHFGEWREIKSREMSEAWLI
ncbi:hypothetical protein BG003_002909 [Podila horticola]|nr:hypothetical protein BG003_002909 [Podila horticola]